MHLQLTLLTNPEILLIKPQQLEQEQEQPLLLLQNIPCYISKIILN